MRQIRIVRNYSGALGRYFKGVCLLSPPELAAQLVQDGYAEYAGPEPKVGGASPTLPEEGKTEGEKTEDNLKVELQTGPETAAAAQGENAMKPAAEGKKQAAFATGKKA